MEEDRDGDGEDDVTTAPLVTAGACDTSWLPAGLVVDVEDAAPEELVELVKGWIDERTAPALDVGSGTMFAKSEDDNGADAPYPSFAMRDASRACGSSQLWLRDRARVLLDAHAAPDMGAGVQCSENVCCYAAAGEYDSSGTFVFARTADGSGWVLRAVAEVADNGTLGEEWVAAERGWVTAQLGRQMRGRCAGEPNVVW